jgi:hypothetical protein
VLVLITFRSATTHCATIFVANSVARWLVFKPKIPIWVNFGGPYLDWTMLIYFMAIWPIVRIFVIFYGHLEYFKDIWDILWPFGTFWDHLVHLIWFWCHVPRKIWQPWLPTFFLLISRPFSSISKASGPVTALSAQLKSFFSGKKRRRLKNHPIRFFWEQGDQMSRWKNRPKCSPATSLSQLMHNSNRGKQ